MKIVLIGDSIREGYDRYVKQAFDGVAMVCYPPENCRFTTYIIRNLIEWKTNMNWGDDVDLIHWNAGCWDNLIMSDGENLISLEQYRNNVDRICRLIKQYFPYAKMIFATTTPVMEEGFQGLPYRRLNTDTERYNEAACEIVQKHGGTINDLYGLLKDNHRELHSDRTHYYSKEGTQVITNQVIACIEEALHIQAKPLDYDLLFGKKEDIVGT